jgi:hypothetical protein
MGEKAFEKEWREKRAREGETVGKRDRDYEKGRKGKRDWNIERVRKGGKKKRESI